mmetsp:Transcript_14214/g.27626  ORF Transcript_14214/g.27626 Transcript_14214/m.27626 type:complete len:97 (-) Transcript_14214:637-927(-)
MCFVTSLFPGWFLFHCIVTENNTPGQLKLVQKSGSASTFFFPLIFNLLCNLLPSKWHILFKTLNSKLETLPSKLKIEKWTPLSSRALIATKRPRKT